ncbi:MAG: EboA domain-containing protein [Daejeonella sp.]|nr:EboA domain-containing protein [Daejeonella sp.]
MFDYDAERLRALITEVSRSNLSPDTWTWLSENLSSDDSRQINTAFAVMSRKTGKSVIQISKDLISKVDHVKPGFTVENWTMDKLGRLCLLLHLNPSDQEKYIKTIENLFLAAEVSELVALYSSLPVLAWPDCWKLRCAEGIRSNIGLVLEAIMYHNPYPEKYLDEKAWNQLILKAFFTDKDIIQIPGIDERANAELALTLTDYAHERWAAKRKINPFLWRFASKFLDEGLIHDLQKVLFEGSLREKQAAALTLVQSGSASASELLKSYPELMDAIKNNELTWASLAQDEEKI